MLTLSAPTQADLQAKASPKNAVSNAPILDEIAKSKTIKRINEACRELFSDSIESSTSSDDKVSASSSLAVQLSKSNDLNHNAAKEDESIGEHISLKLVSEHIKSAQAELNDPCVSSGLEELALAPFSEQGARKVSAQELNNTESSDTQLSVQTHIFKEQAKVKALHDAVIGCMLNNYDSHHKISSFIAHEYESSFAKFQDYLAKAPELKDKLESLDKLYALSSIKLLDCTTEQAYEQLNHLFAASAHFLYWYGLFQRHEQCTVHKEYQLSRFYLEQSKANESTDLIGVTHSVSSQDLIAVGKSHTQVKAVKKAGAKKSSALKVQALDKQANASSLGASSSESKLLMLTDDNVALAKDGNAPLVPHNISESDLFNKAKIVRTELEKGLTTHKLFKHEALGFNKQEELAKAQGTLQLFKYGQTTNGQVFNQEHIEQGKKEWLGNPLSALFEGFIDDWDEQSSFVSTVKSTPARSAKHNKGVKEELSGLGLSIGDSNKVLLLSELSSLSMQMSRTYDEDLIKIMSLFNGSTDTIIDLSNVVYEGQYKFINLVNFQSSNCIVKEPLISSQVLHNLVFAVEKRNDRCEFDEYSLSVSFNGKALVIDEYDHLRTFSSHSLSNLGQPIDYSIPDKAKSSSFVKAAALSASANKIASLMAKPKEQQDPNFHKSSALQLNLIGKFTDHKGYYVLSLNPDELLHVQDKHCGAESTIILASQIDHHDLKASNAKLKANYQGDLHLINHEYGQLCYQSIHHGFADDYLTYESALKLKAYLSLLEGQNDYQVEPYALIKGHQISERKLALMQQESISPSLSNHLEVAQGSSYAHLINSFIKHELKFSKDAELNRLCDAAIKRFAAHREQISCENDLLAKWCSKYQISFDCSMFSHGTNSLSLGVGIEHELQEFNKNTYYNQLKKLKSQVSLDPKAKEPKVSAPKSNASKGNTKRTKVSKADKALSLSSVNELETSDLMLGAEESAASKMALIEAQASQVQSASALQELSVLKLAKDKSKSAQDKEDCAANLAVLSTVRSYLDEAHSNFSYYFRKILKKIAASKVSSKVDVKAVLANDEMYLVASTWFDVQWFYFHALSAVKELSKLCCDPNLDQFDRKDFQSLLLNFLEYAEHVFKIFHKSLKYFNADEADEAHYVYAVLEQFHQTVTLCKLKKSRVTHLSERIKTTFDDMTHGYKVKTTTNALIDQFAALSCYWEHLDPNSVLKRLEEFFNYQERLANNFPVEVLINNHACHYDHKLFLEYNRNNKGSESELNALRQIEFFNKNDLYSKHLQPWLNAHEKLVYKGLSEQSLKPKSAFTNEILDKCAPVKALPQINESKALALVSPVQDSPLLEHSKLALGLNSMLLTQMTNCLAQDSKLGALWLYQPNNPILKFLTEQNIIFDSVEGLNKMAGLANYSEISFVTLKEAGMSTLALSYYLGVTKQQVCRIQDKLGFKEEPSEQLISDNKNLCEEPKSATKEKGKSTVLIAEGGLETEAPQAATTAMANKIGEEPLEPKVKVILPHSANSVDSKDKVASVSAKKSSARKAKSVLLPEVDRSLKAVKGLAKKALLEQESLENTHSRSMLNVMVQEYYKYLSLNDLIYDEHLIFRSNSNIDEQYHNLINLAQRLNGEGHEHIVKVALRHVAHQGAAKDEMAFKAHNWEASSANGLSLVEEGTNEFFELTISYKKHIDEQEQRFMHELSRRSASPMGRIKSPKSKDDTDLLDKAGFSYAIYYLTSLCLNKVQPSALMRLNNDTRRDYEPLAHKFLMLGNGSYQGNIDMFLARAVYEEVGKINEISKGSIKSDDGEVKIPSFELFYYTLEALEKQEAFINVCPVCKSEQVHFNPFMFSSYHLQPCIVCNNMLNLKRN